MIKKKQEQIPYQVPEIITYCGDEILEEILFAQGCTPSPCPTPAFI